MFVLLLQLKKRVMQLDRVIYLQIWSSLYDTHARSQWQLCPASQRQISHLPLSLPCYFYLSIKPRGKSSLEEFHSNIYVSTKETWVIIHSLLRSWCYIVYSVQKLRCLKMSRQIIKIFKKGNKRFSTVKLCFSLTWQLRVDAAAAESQWEVPHTVLQVSL